MNKFMKVSLSLFMGSWVFPVHVGDVEYWHSLLTGNDLNNETIFILYVSLSLFLLVGDILFCYF